MTTSPSWTGAGHHPLPHASAYCRLAQFAYLNVLGYSQVFRLYTGSSTASGSRGFFAQRKKKADFGISDIPAVRAALDECRLWRGNYRFLLNEKVRICPICLAGGFHSIWFQLSLLAKPN